MRGSGVVQQVLRQGCWCSQWEVSSEELTCCDEEVSGEREKDAFTVHAQLDRLTSLRCDEHQTRATDSIKRNGSRTD